MIFPVFFNSSDRVVGGGVYGAGVWSTEPPFASGPRGGREGGMAEEIKSFLISFGTYLFFTFSWWALKTGFDAGEVIVLVFFWDLMVIVVFFFFVFSVPSSTCPVPGCFGGGPLRHQVVPLGGPCRLGRPRAHRHHHLHLFLSSFIFFMSTCTVPEPSFFFFKKKKYNKV